MTHSPKHLLLQCDLIAVGAWGPGFNDWPNLKALLLAPPAGGRATIGLDPGLRTGVKAAVVDATGKVLATATIYPHAPRNDWGGAMQALKQLAQQHQASLIAIGNGTASRETEKMVGDMLAVLPGSAPKPTKVIVSTVHFQAVVSICLEL